MITHSVEPISLIEQAVVDKFLPPRMAKTKLDTNNPMTFGTLTLPDYFTEFKRQQEEAMRNTPEVFDEVNRGIRYNSLYVVTRDWCPSNLMMRK